MIRHCVMFTWAADAADADKAAVGDHLRTLPALIPELKRYEFGPDVGISEGNHDYCVVADFEDEAGYRAYADNLEHQRIIVDHIRPIIAGRTAVQYRVD